MLCGAAWAVIPSFIPLIWKVVIAKTDDVLKGKLKLSDVEKNENIKDPISVDPHYAADFTGIEKGRYGFVADEN